MSQFYPQRIFACVLVCALLSTAVHAADKAPQIRFGRDILPILSSNCFLCHGPDRSARKAKLRLDTHAGALRVIVPGKSAKSELIHRITSGDPEERMPPPKSHRQLTAEQRDLIRRWIDQGAKWGKHWAYETPERPELPGVQRPAWCRNPIDRFVLARLEKEALSPSPPAAKETLLRRVTLDLTGLPPTPKEVDAFLNDPSPDAYEKAVDRLLDSSAYGEHMATDWLDAARYADTNGYQNDFARSMWLWRDWVIRAYNQNMPFDRFTIEQIAGDLLPHPTLQQRIATGFNRNNRTVTEAGSIDDEWRVENNVDRVETTSAVWLGLTMGCARCHDHKFDPLTQKDFYRFFAFFNSLAEKGVYTETPGNVPPLVQVPSSRDRQRLEQFARDIAAAERAVHEMEKDLPRVQHKWEMEQIAKIGPEPTGLALRFGLDGKNNGLTADSKPVKTMYRGGGEPSYAPGLFGPVLALDGKDASFLDAGQAIQLERTDHFSYGGWVKPEGAGAILSKMDDAAAYRGFDLLFNDNKIQVHLVHNWPVDAIKVSTRESLPLHVWSHVLITYDGSSKASGVHVYVNGASMPLEINNDHLTGTITNRQPLRLGKRSTAFALRGSLADIRFYRHTLTPAEVQALLLRTLFPVLKTPEVKRTAEQKTALARLFREMGLSSLHSAEQKLARLRKEKADYEKRIPTVMVMQDLPKPRETFALKRGQYDKPDKSEKLQPDVPRCLTPLPPGAPHNRLGLARWLVDPANPLTARVTVNRYWEHYFGVGLVKTAEDFGVRGERPSHPDLLDWLATEFVRSGWNVKAMQRLVVTSATYRQSSAVSPELARRDPENRLLARGPRFRLSAEAVRDNALAISGLLTDHLGGPSVKPYQPDGLWSELAGGAGEGPYVQDHGPKLYRRSVYVYRKRTVPHPVLATFDTPSREICRVLRARTDTPLQALELLNDVTYVEAARHLAKEMLEQGGATPAARITFAFRRAVARQPTAKELRILTAGLERDRQRFQRDAKAASQFVHQGESPIDAKLNAADLAAYTATASIILNLDETVTKE